MIIYFTGTIGAIMNISFSATVIYEHHSHQLSGWPYPGRNAHRLKILKRWQNLATVILTPQICLSIFHCIRIKAIKNVLEAFFKFICLRISTWLALPWCNQEGTISMRFQIDNCFPIRKQNITMIKVFRISCVTFQAKSGGASSSIDPQEWLSETSTSPGPQLTESIVKVKVASCFKCVIFLPKVDGLVVSKTKVFQSSLGLSGRTVSVLYISP